MTGKNSNNSTQKTSHSPQEEVFTRKFAALLLKQVQQDIQGRKNSQNKVAKKEFS